MNKLLALSVALLSVSLYGAEKSFNGLEGFAKTALTKAQIAELIEGITKDGLGGFSKDVLEGFNKDELNAANFERSVIVVDYTLTKPPIAVYKSFDAKAIKDQVELRLRQSKLKLANTSGYLYVDALPIMTVGKKLYGYTLRIEAVRKVTFEGPPDPTSGHHETYFRNATVWDRAWIVPPSELKNYIDKLMDFFFKAYYKANPKKKEKE